MDLAIKDARGHAGRFTASIVGVGLLMAIVLVMNGIFQGSIADGVWLIDNTATDLWVVERDRGGPFNEQSSVAEAAWKSVAATPDVAQASPFITYGVQREVGGKEQQFTIIGYDAPQGLGGPGRIVAGRAIARVHCEAVADLKLGLGLGERVRLGLHDYTVVRLTEGAVDSGGNPLLYLSLPDAQEVNAPTTSWGTSPRPWTGRTIASWPTARPCWSASGPWSATSPWLPTTCAPPWPRCSSRSRRSRARPPATR